MSAKTVGLVSFGVIGFLMRLEPCALRLKPVLLELVRVDLPLHRVEELGPRVGLELGDELAGLAGPHFGQKKSFPSSLSL